MFTLMLLFQLLLGGGGDTVKPPVGGPRDWQFVTTGLHAPWEAQRGGGGAKTRTGEWKLPYYLPTWQDGPWLHF